jgi:predicted esterase
VLYRSNTATGQPDTVSSTVLVPTTPYPGRRPVVGYAVGTHGLGDDSTVPILMQHGLLDEVTPYSIGNNLRHQYCAKGVTVDLRTYPLADHVLGALVTAPHAITWLHRPLRRHTGAPTAEVPDARSRTSQ